MQDRKLDQTSLTLHLVEIDMQEAGKPWLALLEHGLKPVDLERQPHGRCCEGLMVVLQAQVRAPAASRRTHSAWDGISRGTIRAESTLRATTNQMQLKAVKVSCGYLIIIGSGS